ncbi:unnamed protein product [Protopolystoma xenopodis]|uniref:Uncharacterized protein n=1 Tax=Protopolystoma xenopodis TaxID=117903 RepID=A0A3S5AJ07_9PLAT|nr:unnamed protein product [Protopolystoma xenopodis]
MESSWSQDGSISPCVFAQNTKYSPTFHLSAFSTHSSSGDTTSASNAASNEAPKSSAKNESLCPMAARQTRRGEKDVRAGLAGCLRL